MTMLGSTLENLGNAPSAALSLLALTPSGTRMRAESFDPRVRVELNAQVESVKDRLQLRGADGGPGPFDVQVNQRALGRELGLVWLETQDPLPAVGIGLSPLPFPRD